MNLYFRLCLMLLRLWRARRARLSITDEVSLPFRVWPLDCDANLHLTNGRYFSLMDPVRIYHLGRTGLLREMLRRRWQPVLNAVEMTFIRPLSPLQRFSISLRVLGWDEKYLYLEQRFESPGTLHAVSLGRAAFVGRDGVVAPAAVAALAGGPQESPPLPEAIRAWQRLLEEKRDRFRDSVPVGVARSAL
jgi:acyl-CoA thioesterase FadM